MPNTTTSDLLNVKTETVDKIANSSWKESETTNSTNIDRSIRTQEILDNEEEDVKNVILPSGTVSCSKFKQAEKERSPVKKSFGSEVAKGSLKDNFPPVDKIKSEPFESENDLVPTDFLSSSVSDLELEQKRSVGSSMNVVPSPIKPILTGSSTTTTKVLQTNSSAIQSPSKMVSNSNAVLSSPTKPGTQLVKCVDSQGKVRLLQVRTDVLPKILRKGTAAISTTPPAAQENLAKANLGASVKESFSQPFVPQTLSLEALPQTPSVKVVLQTPTTQVPLQTSLTQAALQTSTKSVLPLPKVSVQASGPHVQSQPSMTQTVSQVPPQTAPKVALTSPVKIQGVQGLSLSPGTGPVLRLVRPGGNASVRPLLVAGSPANQQIIRLPAAAANGNRPLYVLKDGKLFMMKSALGTASASKVSSAPVLNIAPATTSKPQSSQETMTTASVAVQNSASKSLITSQGTSVVNQPLKGSNASTSILTATNLTESKVSERVSLSSVSNRPTLTINPATLLKPRSSVAVPSAVRMSLPKSTLSADDTLQTPHKANSLLAQQSLVPHSLPNTLNTQKISVKSGKSLLKPAVSLLKSNIATAVTPNKSSNSAVVLPNPVSLLRPPSTPSVLGMSDVVTANKRIILGRTLGSSSITTTSQQALTYREILK